MSHPLDYLYECNHPWRDSGDPFKTYPRSDTSKTNPWRQAQKCPHCDAVRVLVLRSTDLGSEKQ